MTPVSTRLVRLLNMVPYFKANPQVTYAEAAADLGVTRKQLQQDLNQLWMCGLPGYGPGDLIDFEFSGDTIKVTFSAGMDAAAAADLAGGHRPAGRAARAGRHPRCRRPAGRAAAPSPRSSRRRAPSPTTTHVAAAVTSRRPSRAKPPRRCAPRSATAGRCASSTTRPPATPCRAASSIRSGWCWSATTAIWRPGAARPRGCGCSGSTASSRPTCSTSRPRRRRRPCRPARTPRCSTPTPRCPSATLLVAPTASWMLEYYPMRVRKELPDGYCEAAMTYASDEWMSRLILGFGADVRVLGAGVTGDPGARIGGGGAGGLRRLPGLDG